MRTIPVLTIAALALAGTTTAYYFSRNNDWAERAEEAKPSVSATATVDGHAPPVREGRRGHPANPEQPQLTRLQEQVAALEARLRHTETAVDERSPRQAVSGPDEPVSGGGAENAQNLSEADFASWMDVALDAGDLDRDATASVLEQAAASVATVPGVDLADLQCGDRFCRATLIPATNERLNIADLAGASPFMGSGTAIYEPDGSVRVYFVPPGESFSKLRSEAQGATFGDSPRAP
jgi:hypothetical protein